MTSVQYKTAIIIPCFNEEQRLDSARFIEYAREDPCTTFIFVDDGSTDRTRFILDELCGRFPDRMQLVSLPENKGKAEAVRQGFLHAFKHDDFWALGYFDADLSTSLTNILHFRNCLEQSDIALVMGARVLMLGYDISRSIIRHYLGRLFATAASLVLHLKVYDTQCGAKLFKNTPALKNIFFDPFSVRWAFDVEVLARMTVIHRYFQLLPVDRCVIEYPLKKWMHVADSKVKIRDFFISFYELMKIWFFRRAPIFSPKYRFIYQSYERAAANPGASESLAEESQKTAAPYENRVSDNRPV